MPTVKATEEMLERGLDVVREPMAEITPVEREARAGDVAVIDVEVEAGGKVVPSESRQALEAELKEGVLIPELMAAILGARVGETRSATVTFPEDYGEPMLAGKEGTIKATVQGIKEKVLPVLDDALASQLSGGKVETVDAYPASVREQFEGSAKSLAAIAREQAGVEALVEAPAVEVPRHPVQ